jgi:hypothetical protein
MRIPSKIEKDDDQERRLRLVKLAYEVLRDMKTPNDATDVEMLSLLSRAFSDRSTVPETPQARTVKPHFESCGDSGWDGTVIHFRLGGDL